MKKLIALLLALAPLLNKRFPSSFPLPKAAPVRRGGERMEKCGLLTGRVSLFFPSI